MRRVQVRHGLKQRINEIMGTDYTGGGQTSPPGITPWSLQAAMIENLKRIVAGISGNEKGVPMNGLVITEEAGNATYIISPGYGFTNNGNIVVIDKAISGISLPSSGSVVNIYAKHSLAYLDGDGDVAGGKKTGFIGQEGEQNIVEDDLGATLGSGITIDDDVIIQEVDDTLSGTDLDNHVYLGQVAFSGGTIDSITLHNFTLNNLLVNQNLEVSDTITTDNITVTDTIALKDANISGAVAMASGSSMDFNGGSELNVNNSSTLNIAGAATVKSGGVTVYTGAVGAAQAFVVENGLIKSLS